MAAQDARTMAATPATAAPPVSLRPMQPADLAAAHALSAALRWPHRPADWAQVYALGEGRVAEQSGEIVGTAQRWRWGPGHATLGLVIVAPHCQGQGIGARLMRALLEGLDGHTALLHATAEGLPLYRRLGFEPVGELRQHQGIAQPSPPVALPPGVRLRPAGASDLGALQHLDAQGRGMPRPALIEALCAAAEATVVLDRDGRAVGFAMLRRFGRGHVIGPVVAPDVDGARALVTHLAGLNAGRFTRIDVDAESGLPDWLEGLGLPRVDAPTTMRRGPELAVSTAVRTFATATQALG